MTDTREIAAGIQKIDLATEIITPGIQKIKADKQEIKVDNKEIEADNDEITVDTSNNDT